MDSTWESRDLPVLEAIVQLFDQTGEFVTGDQIAQHTGFDQQTVTLAVQALDGEDPRLLEARVIRPGGGEPLQVISVYNITGHARRMVGAWPTPENLIARLVAALEAVAATENDTVKRRKLKEAAATVGSIAGQAAASVLAGAILYNAGIP